MGVGTLLLVRADFPHRQLGAPPSGWRVSESSPWTVTWVRRQPVAGAGHPVWSSPGTVVSTLHADDRTLRFRVDDVPDRGGQLVVSALAWPGYHSDLATLDEPVDGYLVTLDIPARARGQVVTLEFSPPGWPLEVTTWWLAVLGGTGWTLLAARRRLRRAGDQRGRLLERQPPGPTGGAAPTLR